MRHRFYLVGVAEQAIDDNRPFKMVIMVAISRGKVPLGRLGKPADGRLEQIPIPPDQIRSAPGSRTNSEEDLRFVGVKVFSLFALARLLVDYVFLPPQRLVTKTHGVEWIIRSLLKVLESSGFCHRAQ